MPDVVSGALRASLEAWEREVAAQWDAFVPAPGTLRRIGGQINQTLITQQRLSAPCRRADSAPRPPGSKQRACSTCWSGWSSR